MESSNNQMVAIVTGSSTGVGYETSLALARNGFLTYATIRNLNKAENIKSIATKESLPLHVKQLDVTDDMHLSLLVLSSWLSFSDDNKNLRPVLIY